MMGLAMSFEACHRGVDSEDTYVAERQQMPDMTKYVKKEDLERMKQDLMDTIGQMSASSGARRTAKGEA